MAQRQGKQDASRAARQRVRVAIVGGGCAGLTAAWELSQRNRERGGLHYEITVFEQSWKLGGKGASVRDRHRRILEHGLHVWLGFYENAFALMRAVYASLPAEGGAPPGPYDSFERAFVAESHLGAALRTRSGAWEAWTGEFPPAPGLPGTPLDTASNPFTLARYIARMLAMVKTLIHSLITGPAGDTRARSMLDTELDFAFEPGTSLDVLMERLAALVRVGALATGAGVLQALAIFETMLRQQSALASQPIAVVALIEAVAKHARRWLAELVGIDEDIRRRTEIIDLVMTIIVGLYRDQVVFAPNGLEAIDDIDCRDWLMRHGASRAAANSPFVRGLYDLAFAYRGGDKRSPSLAAGQALRGALRMFFTYRGAIVWRMRAGMGDVIFSPLYRALVQRGVAFRFNHRLTRAEFNADLSETALNRVTALAFEITHRERPGANWSALDAATFWPETADARFAKLATPAREVWKAGAATNGFDAVVLALAKDDFVATCGALCDRLEHYRQMRAHVQTVATQTAQFWFDADFHALGWRRGPVIMTGMDTVLDSWADMTHTLAAEHANDTDASTAPRAVAYLCGVLADADLLPPNDAQRQDAATALARANARGFLAERGVLDRLVGPTAGDAFAQQHVRANVDGSDRYTLSLPGTLKHRVSPLDGAVVNMTIAGDWTDCGFNEGCVEAAVMSGRLAAHAITGDRPALADIVGYDHP